jgi:hypothetical protein
VPTPAEQAAREAANAALEAAAGNNAQKKVALLMTSAGGSATPADAAWEDTAAAAPGGKGGKGVPQPKGKGKAAGAVPESWEVSPSSTAAAAAGGAANAANANAVRAPRSPAAIQAAKQAVRDLKKQLLAHIIGMEDTLEVAVGETLAMAPGPDQEAELVVLLRRMRAVLDVMQGPAWRGITPPPP